MTRLFNQRQRLLLAFVSGGKCRECSVKLTPENYHADHVQAWSKSGKTTTKNGQALCRACNLKKGSK